MTCPVVWCRWGFLVVREGPTTDLLGGEAEVHVKRFEI